MIVHKDGDNGGYVQREQAVAQQTQGLEEANVPSQQHHIHCEYQCACCAHSKYQLQINTHAYIKFRKLFGYSIVSQTLLMRQTMSTG